MIIAVIKWVALALFIGRDGYLPWMDCRDGTT